MDVDAASINFDCDQTSAKDVFALGLAHKGEPEFAFVRVIIDVLAQFDIDCILLVRNVALNARFYIICKCFQS